jgi:hypothetical protein
MAWILVLTLTASALSACAMSWRDPFHPVPRASGAAADVGVGCSACP